MNIRNTLSPLASRGMFLLLALCMSSIVVTVTGIAWRTQDRLVQTAQANESSHVPQIMRLTWLESNVTRLSLQLFHTADSGSSFYLPSVLNDIRERQRQIEETLYAVEDAALTSGDRVASARLLELGRKFISLSDANKDLIRDASLAQAKAYLLTEVMPVRNRLLGVVHEEKKRLSLLREGQRLDEASTWSNRQLGALAVLFALLLTACYWLVAMWVYRWRRPARGRKQGDLLARSWTRAPGKSFHGSRSAP